MKHVKQSKQPTNATGGAQRNSATRSRGPAVTPEQRDMFWKMVARKGGIHIAF